MGHRFPECKVCHGSSLEQRILSHSHTAPLGVPGSSTSACKVRAAPEGVCVITCIPDLEEWTGAPFGFSFQRNIDFPSTTTAVQVFCPCRDEVFLLALGSLQAEGTMLPTAHAALTLPGAHSSSSTAVGISTAWADPCPQPAGREQPPRPVPPRGPLGRDPGADNRRWVMDSF